MDTHVNEYVVIVQITSTGLTADLFASLPAARNAAEKCSEVWPRVIEADVHQWLDGMATGPNSASGTTLAASRATWPTSGKADALSHALSGCNDPSASVQWGRCGFPGTPARVDRRVGHANTRSRVTVR